MVTFYAVATTRPVAAQEQSSPQTSQSLRAWNVADEITFGSAIREVVSKNPVGAPAGLNLLMSGSQTTLYVSVGPFLAENVKQSLATGQMIQAVGIVRTVNGQNYLLARQLVVGDQTIELRNIHGFLIRPPSGLGPRSAHSQSLLGGAR
jgi:hypothetical protein